MKKKWPIRIASLVVLVSSFVVFQNFSSNSRRFKRPVIPCVIPIHGHNDQMLLIDKKTKKAMFPRAIIWDTNVPIDIAAHNAAQIVEQNITQRCSKNAPVHIITHSYGSQLAYYILAAGKSYYYRKSKINNRIKYLLDKNKRMSKLEVNEEKELRSLIAQRAFITTYERTTLAVNYAAAHKGSPLMNMVCSSRTLSWIAKKLGKANRCIKSLTTRNTFHAYNMQSNFTTPSLNIAAGGKNNNFIDRVASTFISKFGVSWWRWIFKGERNYNDTTVTLDSAWQCRHSKLISKHNRSCHGKNRYMRNLVAPNENHITIRERYKRAVSYYAWLEKLFSR